MATGSRRVKRAGAGRRTAAGMPADSVQRAVGGWFPAVGRGKKTRGLGAAIAVVEGSGDGWDVAVAVADQTASGRGVEGSVDQAASGAAKKLRSRGREAELAGLLAALGSRHRLRVLLKLLEGPATYQALKRVTKLKAGPLYHHLNQLRLAGLMLPKQRDLYELTRAGRNVILGALVLGLLGKDRRRRPVGK